MKKIVLLLLFTVLFTACSDGRREPEQIAIASAVGFDAAEEGLLLSVELPGAEGGSSVISEADGNVHTALRQLAEGMERRLLLSHCALIVLGDSLSEEQLEAVFSFIGAGEELPLEAMAVSSSSAHDLLSAGESARKTVGYTLRAHFDRICRATGFYSESAVYQLRADERAAREIVLPAFERQGESLRYAGLRILRRGASAVTVEPAETTAFALLSGRWIGRTDGQNGLYPDVDLTRLELSGTVSESGVRLLLDMEGAAPPSEETVESIRTLFLRLRGEGDVLRIGERLSKTLGEELLSQLPIASLEVACRERGGRGK